MDDFEILAFRCNLIAVIALLIRLAWDRLFPIYPWFSVFLAARLVASSATLFVSRHSMAYNYFFMVSVALDAILAFLVVMELYRRALASHPALARWGQGVAGAVLIGCAAVAILGLLAGVSGPSPSEEYVQRFFTLRRTNATWLGIVVLMIAAFISWFPVRMKTNVALFALGCLVFFLSEAVEYFMLGRQRLQFTHQWSAIGMVGTFLAYAIWIGALRNAREFSTTIIGHRWNEQRMAQLSRQLNEINETLAQFGRRR